MKIQGPNRPPQPETPATKKVEGTGKGAEAARGRAVATAAQSAPRPTPRGAEVSVSAGARALAEAKAPEVPDQAKIERLREAIAKGELKIDYERIAQRILDEEF